MGTSNRNTWSLRLAGACFLGLACGLTGTAAMAGEGLIPGAAHIWPDDHFVVGRADGETLTGRSAATGPAVCPDDTRSALTESFADRLAFDAYPVRCGGFAPAPAR